jgi:hypothetical protein
MTDSAITNLHLITLQDFSPNFTQALRKDLVACSEKYYTYVSKQKFTKQHQTK